MIINNGIHNSTPFKAVPCDLVAELRRQKDILVGSGVPEEEFRDYFEDLDVCPYAIGSAISLLQSHDVDIDEGDILINLDRRKECGKVEIAEGVTVILLQSYSDFYDSSYYMIQALYSDGKKLCLYTPFEGNWVNVVYQTCLGDEHQSGYIDQRYYDRFYGSDPENVYEDYLKAFDISGFSVDMDKCIAEIKEVLGNNRV